VTRAALMFCTALLGGGCSIGNGVGEVKGQMYFLNCKRTKTPADIGAMARPEPFDLQPRFFAAEPVQGIGRSKINQLIIRLQPTGRQRELNDVLTFIIPDSGAIARCVRGRVDPMTGADYDQANCFQKADSTVVRIAERDSLVMANFSPNATCESTLADPYVRVASATSTVRVPNDGAWDSFSEFADFGAARQPQAADQRTPIGDGFQVDIGERLRAVAFHLQLRDAAVFYAEERGTLVGTQEIGGVLDGWFDFKLERGQGAQSFP
jgi:hypothetical protein